MTKTQITTAISACCAAPLHTRPAHPRSLVASTVTHCTSCGVAVTMDGPPAIATPGCLCCGLLAARGAELPCGDCR